MISAARPHVFAAVESGGSPSPATTPALSSSTGEAGFPDRKPACAPASTESSNSPKAGQPLLTICCVCKVVIHDGALPVSHGYCEPCVEVELAKIEASA